MGLSLLRGITDPDQFETTVAHGMHHVGFLHWAEWDPLRQALLREESGRAVAMRHVQNLCSEGLATFYCSPLEKTKTAAAGDVVDKSQAKLDGYRREERSLLAQSDQVPVLSLKPDADHPACQQACDSIATDPDGMLPMGHYIGARMVEIMDGFHPHERIVECVRSLADFLPLYNQAARETGTPTYDATAVEQFRQMWEA